MVDWMAPEPARAAADVRRPVLTVRAGWRVLALFLGELTGVRLHWVDGRTRPCQGTRCGPCADQIEARPYYYAPCLARRFHARGKIGNEVMGDFARLASEVTLELTARLAAQLPGELAGLAVELSRPERSRAGVAVQTCADFWAGAQAPAELPAPWDVRPILCKMWGVVDEPAARAGIAGNVADERKKRSG